MRFNLRSLLLLSTAIALLFALLFALPSVAAGATTYVLLGLIPMALSCGIYFGVGEARAFSLGALVPILPNSVFCYFITSPAIIVADEINWWNPRGNPLTAGQAFTTLRDSWEHIGHAMLAMQVPVWITATLCGVSAIAAKRSLDSRPKE